jgi:large subunit ribosomal protein L21
MKKAVIRTGSKQYIVSEGDILTVEKLKEGKTVEFNPLLVIDDKKISIGKPQVKGVKVTASIIEADKMADKTTSIRYKAKKRVHTVRGHRQHMSVLKIVSIS